MDTAANPAAHGINQNTDLADELTATLWRQNTGLVLGLTMPPGLPNRPPLAMKLWLFQRFGRGGSGGQTQSPAGNRSSSLTMSIESLEHLVRNRVRMFL